MIVVPIDVAPHHSTEREANAEGDNRSHADANNWIEARHTRIEDNRRRCTENHGRVVGRHVNHFRLHRHDAHDALRLFHHVLRRWRASLWSGTRRSLVEDNLLLFGGL